ncbi:MAG: hypothetical protein H6635_02590 [Anaerolineales bacterium]|nr:hypothetical protein [Anaerolineales bacterium]MCB9144229.1 hypothetical protein [Anaerolineales bacterium]
MNRRDIELLSAYLDGQLNAVDSARLEARLNTDPELDSALRSLRTARSVLQKLPSRKAPHNFTLTRQMAGLKPPMPRAYPFFRLATVFASILFLVSFASTALSSTMPMGAAAPMSEFSADSANQESADMAMESAPMEAMEEAPAAAFMEDPSLAAPAQSMGTATPQIVITEDGARIAVEATSNLNAGEAETSKTAPSEELTAPETAAHPKTQKEAASPYQWALIFFIISLSSGIATWAMKISARKKWR